MRRLTLHAGLIVALLVVFGAGSFALAHGNKRQIKSDDMSGYLEAPPVSSTATGKFRATINDSNDEIQYTLTYSGLEAPVAQAHIHFGQRSVSGGISAWLCEGTVQSPSASTPPCPGEGGTVSGTITPLEVIGPGSPPASRRARAARASPRVSSKSSSPRFARVGRTRTCTRRSSPAGRFAAS